MKAEEFSITDSLKPLREWIEGNSGIDQNMRIELIDITGEIIQDVIKQCGQVFKNLPKNKGDKKWIIAKNVVTQNTVDLAIC